MTKHLINILENLAIVPDSLAIEKGFYAPNLTQEEMLAFIPSSDGVIIFNTDTQIFMTFTGAKWVALVRDIGAAIIPSSDSAPVNPVEGQMYLDTTTRQLRIFFMDQWSAIPRVIV